MSIRRRKEEPLIRIPEHSDAALAELEEYGIDYFDYANYEGDHIVAYKRWGRGFTKTIISEVKNGK